MSYALFRLGQGCYEFRWRVIAAWLVALMAVSAALLVSPPKLSNEVRIDGTPAQGVLDELAAQFPAAAGGQGLIAFQAAGGRLDEGAQASALVAAVDRILTTEHVVDTRAVLAHEFAQGPRSHLVQAMEALSRAPKSTTLNAPREPRPLVVNGQPVPGLLISADGSAAIFQFNFDAQTFELPDGTVDRVIGTA